MLSNKNFILNNDVDAKYLGKMQTFNVNELFCVVVTRIQPLGWYWLLLVISNIIPSEYGQVKNTLKL